MGGSGEDPARMNSAMANGDTPMPDAKPASAGSRPREVLRPEFTLQQVLVGVPAPPPSHSGEAYRPRLHKSRLEQSYAGGMPSGLQSWMLFWDVQGGVCCQGTPTLWCR